MSTKAPQSKRLLFVDSLRGLAVLFMIQLHTSHGWLRAEARMGRVWDAAQFFGGLAAPLFLMLAGVGLGIQWSEQAPQGGSPRASLGRVVRADHHAASRKSLARGLQLVVLGYALRLQMWIIDGAAYSRAATFPALGMLAAGYVLALQGVSRFGRGDETWAWASRAAGGVALALVGIAWAYRVDPTRADGLVRVDVLQCIGASLCILSSLGARAHSHPHPGLYVGLATLTALATSELQRAVPGPLPEALSAYIAQAAEDPSQRRLALFPLLPWLSYAATGVALGLGWGRLRSEVQLHRLLVCLVASASVAALLTNGSWTPMRWIQTPQPLTLALRVAYKTALCLVMTGPALALSHAPRVIAAPLALLGRNSLLIYWVHLELAFGTLSRPVASRLGTTSWAWGTLLLIAAMWALATLRRYRHSLGIARWSGRTATG